MKLIILTRADGALFHRYHDAHAEPIFANQRTQIERWNCMDLPKYDLAVFNSLRRHSVSYLPVIPDRL